MQRVIALFVVLALASCATAEPPKVAVCDGKHRRPANLYGSVLPDAPLDETLPAKAPAPVAAAPAEQTTPAPATPSPGLVSAIDPRSLLPCGRQA
jgi:hypothetical protein